MSLLFLKELCAKHQLKLVDCYKRGDYGPLDYIGLGHLHNFENSFYALVQPIEQIKLFKLNSFNRTCLGRNYFCLLRSDMWRGEQSLAMNYSLVLPSCFKFFIGVLENKKFTMLKAQTNLIVAFIPDEYLRLLIELQFDMNSHDLIGSALSHQTKFFQTFINSANQINATFLEGHFTIERTLKYASKGSNLNKLPTVLRKALVALSKSKRSVKISEKLPEQIFLLHEKTLRLPDGRVMKFSLIFNAAYEGSQTFLSKKLFNKSSLDVLHKYNIIFNWI